MSGTFTYIYYKTNQMWVNIPYMDDYSGNMDPKTLWLQAPPGCIESPSEVLVRLPGELSGTDPFPTRPGPLTRQVVGEVGVFHPKKWHFFSGISIGWWNYGCRYQFTIPFEWKNGRHLFEGSGISIYLRESNKSSIHVGEYSNPMETIRMVF